MECGETPGLQDNVARKASEGNGACSIPYYTIFLSTFCIFLTLDIWYCTKVLHCEREGKRAPASVPVVARQSNMDTVQRNM